MFNFLKMQYRMGRLDAADLIRFVEAGRITEEQRQTIIGAGQVR